MKTIKKITTPSTIPSTKIIDSLSSTSNTDALSANKGRELSETKQDKLLVAHIILTSDQQFITIDGLDINRDGGVYDFIISTISTDSQTWFNVRINGISEKIYSDKRLYNGNNLSYGATQNYIGNLTAMPMGVSTRFEHITATTTGILSLDKQGNSNIKVANLTSKSFCPSSLDCYDIYSNAYKISNPIVNITSLVLFQDNFLFKAGTEIKIYKR